MINYNKVYFLHIPKTGGRFFTKYVLNPISDLLKQNGIELIKLPEDVMQHGGWIDDIDDKTYIISIFREPVEFYISVLAHMVSDEQKLLDANNHFILKDKNNIADIDPVKVYEKLEKLPYLENFQAKNFMLKSTDKSVIQEARIAHDRGDKVDRRLVYERIARTNLMIRHKDLKDMDYNLLLNKLSLDLGIELDIDLNELDKEYFKNGASENLFNKLGQEEKDFIYDHFQFDKKIYDNDNLFWQPTTI